MNKINLFRFSGLVLLVAASLACGQSAVTTESPPVPQVSPLTTESPPILQTRPPVSTGDTSHALSFGGEERTYTLHIPPAYDASHATPLVLVFHGFNLSGDEMIRITGFSAQADAATFIVAYPNGSGGKPGWNGGDCCGEAAVKQVDDVGFVRALIQEISGLANIDAKRVYASGFSNGAIMAYRLACELSDQIAAIGPVSATQGLQTCQPGRPVSVIHFHGTADKLNPYEGGTGPGGGVKFASVQDTIQSWVKADSCPPQAQTNQTGNIKHETFSPCAQGTAVELYTIQGGEHAWPGGGERQR